MSKTISTLFKEIDDLSYKVFLSRNSFRFLSTVTFSNYGSIYKNMKKGGLPAIGKAEDAIFLEIRKGRPSKADIDLLNKIPLALRNAMAVRGITPKCWSNAHGVGIFALIDPRAVEMDCDLPVQSWLIEDFPEAYGITVEDYKLPIIRPSFIIRLCTSKTGKKYYWIRSQLFSEINVSHKNIQQAELRAFKLHNIYCTKERLKTYLEEGLEATLSWGTEKQVTDGSRHKESALMPMSGCQSSPETIAFYKHEESLRTEKRRLEDIIHNQHHLELQLLQQLREADRAGNYNRTEQIEDQLNNYRREVIEAQQKLNTCEMRSI